MVTRLSTADASFYHLENTSTPMYVGSLAILRKPRSGLSYETLLAGFDAFAGAAAKRADSRAWLDEQKPGGRPLQQQTQALQELIKSCR